MSRRATCAYCRTQAIEARWRPFCSERCQMADLGKWLGGDYRVPGPAPSPGLLDGQDDEDIEDGPSPGESRRRG